MMIGKKISKLFAIIACVLAAAFALFGCSAAPKGVATEPHYAIAPGVMEKTLEEFVTDREDRTRYTKGEAYAAEYLADKLASYGLADARIEEFTAEENGKTGLVSRNVIAVYRPDGLPDHAKNVVIGAFYDNCHSTPYADGEKGNGSHGALSNGTGVATALAVAEYLGAAKPEFEFTVTFVFFGASAVSFTGARYYYEKQMTSDEKLNTVLMIELQRLGVDNVYAYCDSRETKREGFFDRIAADGGLDVRKATQKSPNMIGMYALNGVPYFHWAQNGRFKVFFDANIPTLNLVGANWETIDLTDTESADEANLEYTENDTLAKLKAAHPDYGEKMAAAATLVISGLSDGEFLQTMKYDRENFPDTDILMKYWIWHTIVLAVIIIAAFVMSLITSALAKKYTIPVAAPARKMKMAVFGMDYEDRKPDEIYIDIKRADPFEEIFPGISNNDDPSARSAAPPPEKSDEQNDGDNGDPDDPFDGV